ncbi:sodium:solute symporter [Verrucomicrobia bacterium SCGC AG-212-E04]|nr:sodium:solute symporter [Verrucomicrobia bacterium SCGC AG-212-E04]
MNWFDYIVLLAALLAIPIYGLWKTRHGGSLEQYLKGDASIRWGTIGLSVMATQAGPITFLSMPGQAYENGMAFVQNYFGQPFALIAVCAIFVPIYHRLKVYTAYEYLGQRFDQKTRLLGAFLFLIQRGLAAGITIYAPAIIISALVGWPLNVTICLAGGLVVLYTMLGGTKIVSITQQYQMGVIFFGMAAAFAMAIYRLPNDVSFGQALSIAGSMDKLEAVDFSFDYHKRYTFWSGALGGFFLALSYFGADQSQVGRYLAGESPVASRFGLMFNAVVKVPMQFLILLVGVMVFVVYQFEKPPIFFNQPAVDLAIRRGFGAPLAAFDQEYTAIFEKKKAAVMTFVKARAAGSVADLAASRVQVQELDGKLQDIRKEARAVLQQADPNLKNKDSDYVFLTFVLNHLPHGLVGLLVAVIFSAAMSATAATLNALGSTTTVDFYRPLIRPSASDGHYLLMTKLLTAGWGLIAIGVALFANFVESLIEAGNILGSLFYGSILGLFLVAFFLRTVRGTAVFIAALVSQVLVLVLFFTTGIGYLWYNLIGCAGVILLGFLLQATLFRAHAGDPPPNPA